MSLPNFRLNTGATIPAIGFGTWKAAPGEVAVAVKIALESGYRHLDCAHAYGNEAEVGKGIRESGVPREEIFVTTKLWSTFHTDVEGGLDASLQKLGLDYVDLFLVHYPVALNPNGNDPRVPTLPDGTRDMLLKHDFNNTWRQMEAVYKSGKAKAIGVSNMSIPKLERLLKSATVVPAANQIELHPLCPQTELVGFCKSRGILPQGYSPLGSNQAPIVMDPKVTAIAKKYGCNAGNILISYQYQRGVNPLPKSVTPSRIKGNLKLVKLDCRDIEIISKMHGGKTHRFVKHNWAPFSMEFPDWN